MENNGRLIQSRGFSMVEMLITSTVLVIAFFAILSLVTQLQKQQAQSAYLVELSIFRANLVTLITSNTSWDRTIALNPNTMSCLQMHTQCTDKQGNPLKEQPFAIYDASSPNAYYDATGSSNGLTASTKSCVGFSNPAATNTVPGGSDDCPFRFDLKWSAICTPPNCIDPQVSISAPLLYSPASQHFAINPSNYSVPTIYRSAQ